MRGSAGLQFRVLGPLEVLDDDHLLPLGGPQQRLLLAALLAHANSVVPVDALIEILWGDDPPGGDGSARLAKSVYRLRETLGTAGSGDYLITRRPGYVLSAGADRLDSARFSSMLSEAQGLGDVDAQAALNLLDAALGMWRGPAWADIADHDFIGAEVARLEDLRATAVEERAGALLALGRHEELVPHLEVVTRQHPLRERPRAQLMLSLYRSGRQTEAVAAFHSFRRYLRDEMGLDPSPDLRRIEQAILQHRPAEEHRPQRGPAVDARTCPYKGLAAFGVGDAPYFAGREPLIAELIARLAVDPFLAVVGSSGSGKSSLVAAGLIPALAAGALPGSRSWACRTIRPGANPIHALACALGSLSQASVLDIEQRLASSPDAIDDLVWEVSDGRRFGERFVLVVDQFEEVFTTCADPSARASFIETLVRAPAAGRGGLAAVLVIRADYYGACAERPELAKLLSRGQVVVPAMTDVELRRALVEPARRAGLALDDGLVDLVIEDTAGVPGALPLVSTALLETWVRRAGTRLTLAGYAATGGVKGAVGRLADGVYDDLDGPGQDHARRIFLRLTDPEGDRTDVRRRAPRDELAATDAEERVLGRLIDGRLLTASEDTVEVAHEALMREWPRLRNWLEEDRDGRRVHRRLADAALAWQADQRDDAGLYRGVRLHAAREWDASHPGDANRLETEFLVASETVQERALRGARRTARRLRLLAVGLAVLLAAAIATGVVAASQRSQARHDAALARSRELQADVSRLAGLAGTLPNDQRDLALLFGAEAYKLDPSDQGVGGLQAAVVNTPPGLDRIIRYPSATNLPHLDRSGRLLAAATTNGATVYNVATGAIVQTMRWPHPREFAVFSSDDSLVAAGGFDGAIAIWDASTGELSGKPLRVGGKIGYAVFDPNDRNRMYTVTDIGELRTWDRRDPEHPREVGGPSLFQSGVDASVATISPDGRLLAAGQVYAGSVSVFDLRTGLEVHYFPGRPGVFGADSTTLPVISANRTILYNASTGREITAIPTPGAQTTPVVSNDGSLVAVDQATATGSVVQVYDVASRRPVGASLRLHGNGAAPVGFLPDGRLLTTGNNEAAIWSPRHTLPPLAVSLPGVAKEINDSIFVPGSNEVITVSELSRKLIRHDARTGISLGALLSGRVKPPIAFDPVRSLVAAADVRTGQIGIWNLTTGSRLAEVHAVVPFAALGWSHDGHQLATDGLTAIEQWNLTDPSHPHLVASIPTPGGEAVPNYLMYSIDGRWILTAQDRLKRVTVIDARAHRIEWSTVVNDFELDQVAVSPDGNTVAVDSGDLGKGRVSLYDTSTGTSLQSVATQSNGGVTYLHGGAWLVVTSGVYIHSAQLYDSRTMTPIGIPFPIPNVWNYVAANTAGTMFSEAEFDAPQLWDVDPSHWVATACAIAGRNLTQAEWHRYLPNLQYQATCPQWPTTR